MRFKLALLLCTMLCACDVLFPKKDNPAADLDHDGYTTPKDCNDEDPDIHPGADEYCDDVDWDCDGEVMDSHAIDAAVYYADLDNDGRGDPQAETRSCTAVDGYVTDATDCDDSTPRVSPDLVEVCDGLDNDCDDEVDEDGASDATQWHLDADGDGFGTDDAETQSVVSCVGPEGYVDNNDDCNDGDSTVYPDATDQWYDGVDQDCSGGSDHDADGDGFEHMDSSGDDCDDDDPSVHPDADEICNDGIDNDCDGTANSCGIFGEFDLSDASGLITGEDNRDQVGNAIASAGDVNGDGEADVLIDARFSDDGGDNAGAVYLLLGPLEAGETGVEEADAQLIGEAANDEAGTVNISVGDLDADGYDDIAISAIQNSTGGTFAGAVYIVHGPIEGNVYLSDADTQIYGDELGGLLGWSMAPLSHTDASGRPGVAIGIPFADLSFSFTVLGAGAVAIVSGDVTGEVDLEAAEADIIYGEAEWNYAGVSVTASDFDGDGFDDVVVGAPGYSLDEATDSENAGKVYLLNGPSFTHGLMVVAEWSATGEAAGDTLGSSVKAVGDIDADGYADMVIGAGSASGTSGIAYVVRGGDLDGDHSVEDAAVTMYLGDVEEDLVGLITESVGDLNGDGTPDLAFGAPAHSPDPVVSSRAGVVYIASAVTSGTVELGTDADARLLGEYADDESGTSIAGIGDTNADGYDDMLVGAPFHDSAGTNAGAVYLLLGGSL
jgi:hypothetical protein